MAELDRFEPLGSIVPAAIFSITTNRAGMEISLA
jgi:hypothetical protein